MYIVVKTGSCYDYGVLWIGRDKPEAIRMANHFANNNDDGKHDYQVRQFRPAQPSGPREDGSYDWESRCLLVYATKRESV